MLVQVVGRGRVTVELGLERPQRRDHGEAALDRVASDRGGTGVGGAAADGDFEPQHPNLGRLDAETRRLGDDDGVGRTTVEDGLERPMPRALLFDDRLQLHRCKRLQTERPEPRDGTDNDGEPGLHIARAAAIEPVAVPASEERRRAPHVDRLRADDVDVAVEDERAAAATLGGTPIGENVAFLADIPAEWSRAGVRANGIGIEGLLADGEFERGEGVVHDLLADRLRVLSAGCGDEIRDQPIDRRPLCRNRAEDFIRTDVRPTASIHRRHSRTPRGRSVVP